MADENDSFAPGSHGVINRLAELSVSQALRIAFAERAGRDSAFRSFRDPQIARSTARIHASSGWPSTVGVLASEVALSRSALATRYRQVVGESPMSYLTRTRLAFAASTLRSTDRSLQEIARQVGYATQFSFSNAFKRTFGLSPREYRGQSGGMSSHPTFVEAARTPATNEGANGAA
jgi:AraC-like DNA-binding protein